MRVQGEIEYEFTILTKKKSTQNTIRENKRGPKKKKIVQKYRLIVSMRSQTISNTCIICTKNWKEMTEK